MAVCRILSLNQQRVAGPTPLRNSEGSPLRKSYEGPLRYSEGRPLGNSNRAPLRYSDGGPLRYSEGGSLRIFPEFRLSKHVPENRKTSARLVCLRETREKS